jgi:hypothetical protein
MGALSPILRIAKNERLHWWCPGCDEAHGIHYGTAGGPTWTWDGSVDKPTFSPSVLVQGSKFTEKGQADYDAWKAAGFPKHDDKFESIATVCHSFVKDGKMQFLGDCTHQLANQTVDIPVWPL